MENKFMDFQKRVRLLGGLWSDEDHVFFDKCNDRFFVAAYKMDSDVHQKDDLEDFAVDPYEYEIVYDVQNELCDLSFEDKAEKGLTMQEVSNCVNRRVLDLISAKIHEIMSGPDSPFIVREEELDSGHVPYELYDAGYELFGDYNEYQIPEETLCCMIDSAYDKKEDCSAWEIFWDYLEDSAADVGFYYHDEVIRRTLCEAFKPKHYPSERDLNMMKIICKLYKDDVERDILSRIYFFYDAKSFYKQKILVDIMLDTGNLNFCNNCDDLLSDVYDPDRLSCSSLLYLADLQGEKEALLSQIEDYKSWCKEQETEDYFLYRKEHLVDKSEFICSAMDELSETSSLSATTTILASMHLDKLMDLLNDQKLLADGTAFETEPCITVFPLQATIGLFDQTNGAGGPLEIQLDKAVEIPISKLLFEVDGVSNRRTGYSIMDTYGVGSSLWTDCVTYNYPNHN